MLSMLLSGCAKEDPATPLSVDWNRTATVKGRILIKKDFKEAKPTWAAPENVKFSASIPYSGLNSNASGKYIIPQDRITYDSSTGDVTVVFPVGITGAALTLKFSDFEGKITEATKGDSKDVIWKSKEETSSTVLPGEVAYLDTWMLQTEYVDFEVVTKKGDEI
ncbi:MAG: hypothetical protein LBR08_06075 [Bacteroidales bacterium]|nr:hypothetical protein [Bacteroidales bacterium]